LEYGKNYIPKNLEDSLSYLDCIWSESDKTDFKSKDEEEAIAELHLVTGMSIRNNWGLWRGRNSLSRYFKSKGVFHPDDISSIILTSFHRRLNNIDINLEEQITYYKKYWEDIRERDRLEKEQNKADCIKFNKGDFVTMDFTISRKKTHAFLYNISKAENSMGDNICQVTGIIKKKRASNKKGCYLDIEVTKICEYQEVIYGNKKGRLSVGDILKYDAGFYNISKQ
jgi:hypothetical protein